MSTSAASHEDVLLTVPSELVNECQAVAIDVGGSVTKFIYRAADDERGKRSDNGQLGCLHLVSFPRRDLQAGLDYIKQRTNIVKEDGAHDHPTLHVTGFGSTEFGKLICRTLNVRLQNVTEQDCFAKAFFYLSKRQSRHHLLEPFDVDACAEPIEFIKNQMAGIAALQSSRQSQAFQVDFDAATRSRLEAAIGRSKAENSVEPPVDTVLSDAEPDTYPCLLIVGGSAVQILKIEQDGTFKLLDAFFQGGRSFWGIGALLTGCTSYAELVELAARGDHNNVDQNSMDQVDLDSIPDDDSSSYKLRYQANAGWTFSFGKAANGGQGNFRREDLARAWLRYFANEISRSINSSAALHDVSRVFFCGGLFNSSVVRRVFTAEMIRRNLLAPQVSQEQLNNSSQAPNENSTLLADVASTAPNRNMAQVKQWISILVVFICVAITQVIAYFATPEDTLEGQKYVLNMLAGYAIVVQWIAFLHAGGFFGNERTEKYYDLIGSLTYLSTLVISFAVSFAINGRMSIRQIILDLFVAVWSARLGWFLFSRIHNNSGVDSRFTEIKASRPQFCMTWTVQGVWVFLTMLPVLMLNVSKEDVSFGVFDYVGIPLWVVGFLFEIVADHQKRAFRKNPENRDTFIHTGLWSISRHPNYFGEIVLWIGIALSAFGGLSAKPRAAFVFLSPVFVAFLLIFVSGIPMLERKADEKFGDNADYMRYKRNTAVLVPFMVCNCGKLCKRNDSGLHETPVS